MITKVLDTLTLVAMVTALMVVPTTQLSSTLDEQIKATRYIPMISLCLWSVVLQMYHSFSCSLARIHQD